MKIQQFHGGLSTRLKSHMIGINEAIVYENIDNEVGILAPVKKSVPSILDVEKYNHMYIAEREWLTHPERRQYVEYEKILYWTDGTGRPQKYDGTNQYNLGITPPTTAPTVAPDNTVQAVEAVDLTPGYAGDLPSTIHKYILVNDDGNFFSAPLKLDVNLTRTQIQIDWTQEDFGAWYDSANDSFFTRPFLNQSTLATRNIVIQNIIGLTFGSNGVKVYREYGGTYRLVGSLANDAATLDDSTYDISANDAFDEADVSPIKGTIQYVYTFYNSADGTESVQSPASAEQELNDVVNLTVLEVSTDPQVDKKRIYRIGGNLASFALVDTIDNADVSYIDNTEDTDIVGTILTAQSNVVAPTALKHLSEAYAILFGAEDNKLRFTQIGKPNYWPEDFFLLFNATITGVAPVANGILVFTHFRTYIILGTNPNSFTQHPLSGDQGCIAEESIQLVSEAAVWASTDGVCVSNGSRVEVVTKEKTGKLIIDPVDSALLDEVYYVLDTNMTMLAVDFRYGLIIKNLKLGVNTVVSADDRLFGYREGVLYALFESAEVETFKYTSPNFVEGKVSEFKTYKKIQIYSTGTVIVDVLIDNVIVKTKELIGADNHQVQVPQDKQRGHFIQFHIEGTGEVYEIEYIAGRSEND